MRHNFFYFFFLFSFLNSYSQDSELDNYIEIKQSDLIGFGDCIKYNPLIVDEHSGEIIGEIGLLRKSDYLGKVYVNPNCVEIIRLKKDSSILDGVYKITQLSTNSDEVNLNKIDFIIAEFKKGKREGIWEYYLSEWQYKDIQTNKTSNYPIKREIYKEGLPSGIWEENRDNFNGKYFYENGILKKEIITKDGKTDCLFYEDNMLIEELSISERTTSRSLYRKTGLPEEVLIISVDGVSYYIYENGKPKQVF